MLRSRLEAFQAVFKALPGPRDVAARSAEPQLYSATPIQTVPGSAADAQSKTNVAQ